MKKVLNVNVQEFKVSEEKISVYIKNFNNENYSELKCFMNYDDMHTIEVRKINLIKIQKLIFFNLPNLQIVDLRDNKLLKISKNFQNLKNLKHLKLDDNIISFLPNFICNLENLESLTISNNKLKYLPTSIQYMHKLKIFKISNNQISSIPIEFGMLKSLECLYIDANYFVEIPTTLCYLKHLSELSFEWLEFLEPPFQKVIKENIGKTIITLIRNTLQEMIKQNFLNCDLITFIQHNSNSSSRKESKQKLDMASAFEEESLATSKFQFESSGKLTTKNNITQILQDKTFGTVEVNSISTNKKLMKIFYAIEHNYFGVIKALLNSNNSYLIIKNTDNKTPLYLSIQNSKFDITNLLLTKIDFSQINNSHIYLHKAIRMRDPVLTEKLINMGVSVEAADDQGKNYIFLFTGSTCFHILFSSFTKHFYKCSVIGDILLRKHCNLNSMNNDSWAPTHIAARRASKECLTWIINQNVLLKNSGREVFELNIQGKNKWTPLHLSVNGFRIVETVLLLKAGCDVFAKNSDGKIPRKVANGNFLLTKLLRSYENNLLKEKYPKIDREKTTSMNQVCFTTVEDLSNVEDFSSFVVRTRANIKNDYRIFSPIFSEDVSKSASKVISYSTSNLINNNSSLDIKKLNSNFDDLMLDDKSENKEGVTNNASQISLVSNTTNDLISKAKNNPKEKDVQKDIPKFTKFIIGESIKNKSANKINLIPTPARASAGIKPSNYPTFTKDFRKMTKDPCINNIKKIKKTNLHFHKEIILNPESSLAEKYESLMHIKFTSEYHQSHELENIIKSLLEALDLEVQINNVIFVDICNMIIVNRFFELIQFLEMMQRSLTKKTLNNLIQKELSNTILLLKSIQESLKKTMAINVDALFPPSLRTIEKKSSGVSNSNKKINLKGNVFSRSKAKAKMNYNTYNQVNSIPHLKQINKYFETDNKYSKNEDILPLNTDNLDANEINEISQSYISMNYYNVPSKNGYVDVNGSNSHSINDESCNIADSSWSIARYDEQVNAEVNVTATQQSNTYTIERKQKDRTDEVKCDSMKPLELDSSSASPIKKKDTDSLDIYNQ